MSDPTRSEFDPTQLLAHRDFVRALARRLVWGDEAAAELAQRTLAAALDARPETGSRLRGWLAKVLLRLRDRGWRDDARRTRREQGAAVRESLPATADLVEQIEAQQRVAAAFGRLPEPYRSTLFLRYWHDLAPSAIAAQTDVPIATVKTRLRRGLERLRAELDEFHAGGRGAWAGMLVPLLGAGPIVGGVIMGAKLKVAAAAAVVATAGWLCWRIVDTGSSARTAEAGSSPQVAEAAVVDRLGTPDESPSSPAPIANPIREPVEIPFASGFVVDTDGRPLPDVLVVPLFLDRREKRNVHAKPLVFDEAGARAITRTDEVGAFTVAAIPPDAATLALVKTGYEVVEWSGFSRDLAKNQGRRFVLPPAREIRGVVRDSAGHGVAQAIVMWFVPPGRSVAVTASHMGDSPTFHRARMETHRLAVTDESGRFVLASLPAGRGRLWTYAHGYGLLDRHEDEEAPAFVVELPRTWVILDVRDSASDAPLADATAAFFDAASGEMIEAAPWDDEFTLPDHQRRMIVKGRLTLWVGSGADRASWVPEGGGGLRILASVDAPGFQSRSIEFVIVRGSEPPHFVVPLEAGDDPPCFAGRVTGADEARVEVRPRLEGSAARDITVERTRPIAAATCDADGTFAIGGLHPGRYRIDVAAPGCAPLLTTRDVPDTRVSLELAPASTLEIAVLDALGEPAPEIDVHLQLADASRAWCGTTDESGVFVAAPLPAGEFLVGAFPEGVRYTNWDTDRRPVPRRPDAFLEFERVAIGRGETRRFEVPVPSKLPFVLRVVDREGAPIGGAQIKLRHRSGWLTRFRDEQERLRALDARTESSGEYRIDCFPGRYDVDAAAAGIFVSQEIDVPLAPDGATTIVIPISSRFGEVRGRVTELGTGTPVAGRLVAGHFLREDGSVVQLEWTCTDAEGRFHLERVPAVAVVISAVGDANPDGFHDPASPYQSTDVRVDVVSAETIEIEIPLARKAPFDAALPVATVEATVLDATTRAPLAGAWVSIAGRQGSATLHLRGAESDAEGRVTLDVPLLDEYELDVRSPREPAPDREPTHDDCTVHAEQLEGRIQVEIALEPRSSGR